MQVLNICKDNRLPYQILPRINDLILVELSPFDRNNYKNVWSLIAKEGMNAQEFSKMLLRYVEKYDCQAVFLGLDTPKAGLIDAILNKENIVVCYPITVTSTVTSFRGGGEGMAINNSSTVVGISYHRREGIFHECPERKLR